MIDRLKKLLEKRGHYFFKPSRMNGSPEFEIDGLSYGVNIPQANFSPWRNDEDFTKIYAAASKNTLVDMYRCYELWQLVNEALKKSSELNVIEIGVWRGGTASLISKRMQMSNQKGTLYLADTFAGVVKIGEKDSYYVGGEHNDTSKEIVENFLRSLALNNFEILQGTFPDETADLIPGNIQFGLVHIDVDVYLSAKDCLDWVWDKLIVGGIVVFDDYGFHTCDGVTRLVEEQRQYNDRIVIHNLNGHGLLIKTS